MLGKTATARCVRFGPCRYEVRSRELRYGSVRVVLPLQEATLLGAFLERPQQVLSKAELAALLWPGEQYGDFDRAIHNLISKLRRIHPEAAGWFETVRKMGYRFRLGVVEEPPPGSEVELPLPVPAPVIAVAASEALPTPETVEPGLEPVVPDAGRAAETMPAARSSVGRWVTFACLGVLLLVAAFLYSVRHRQRKETPLLPMTVGVLPLAADRAQAGTADTLRGALSDALASLPNVEVRAEHSLPQPTGVLPSDLQNVARDLKLDLLLSGSFAQTASGYTLNLELIRGKDGTHLRSLHYEGSLATLGAIPNRVADDLAPHLLRPTLENQQHLLGGTTSAPAFDLAFRGQELMLQRTRESVTQAANLYQQAIRLDPDFARAWAGLAECHLVLANFGSGSDIHAEFEEAKQAATKALALDASNAQAHSTLGLVLLQHDWNFAAAERELRLAISIAPGSAVHYLHLSLLLADEGRYRDAENALVKAAEVDPAWPVLHGTAMYVHISARDNDAAIRDAQALVASRPEWGRAHRHMGWAFWYAGKHSAAIQEWITADNLDHRPAAARSESEGLALLSQKGVRAYAEHKLAAQKSPETADDDFVAAEWYAFAGDTNHTLEALEALIKQRDPESLKIFSNPAYDFLRTDDRFRRITAELSQLTSTSNSTDATRHS